MLLEKWYLDAVFPDGRVWFGYRARVRVGRWPPLMWLAGGMAPLRERKMAGPASLSTASGELRGSGIWEEVKWV